MIIEKDEQGYGVLKTNVERAFDFETMETVIFEVIAREANTKDHYTATVEFTINVIDVNDETPQIIIVSKCSLFFWINNILMRFI